MAAFRSGCQSSNTSWFVAKFEKTEGKETCRVYVGPDSETVYDWEPKAWDLQFWLASGTLDRNAVRAVNRNDMLKKTGGREVWNDAHFQAKI